MTTFSILESHLLLDFCQGIKMETIARDNQLTSGQFIQWCIKSIGKARAVLYVDSDPDVIAKHVVKDLKGVSINLVVPGMMLNARVTSVLENGIMLSFLTYFTGTRMLCKGEHGKTTMLRTQS